MIPMLTDRFPTLARHWTVLKTAWSLENETAPNRPQRREHAFLPAALEIMETPPSPGLRYLLLGLCGLFTIALIWSVVGKVDVVATASGKVIPSGNVKLIQTIEIGSVRAIHITNGQHVKKGQVLIELDPTISSADAAQAAQGLASAELIAARNAALISHLKGRSGRFVPPSGVAPALSHVQSDYVRTAIAEYEGQRASLVQQQQQARADLAASLAEIAKLEQTLPLVNEQLAGLVQLAAQGYYSKLKLIEYKQLKVEHLQNIEVQRAGAAKARAAIATLSAEIARLRGSFGKTSADELAQARDRAGQAREEVTKSAQRSRFQRLTAPVSGTVQQLAVSTIGGVVQPAQTLLVIVPDNAQPQVEVYIVNKDIGFVHPGQNVRIKLEAYPFTDYGIIPGVVEHISRDAIDLGQSRPVTAPGEAPAGRTTAPQGLVYAARIRLLKNSIRVRGIDQPIGSGLAAQAEIKTGQRRIIQYLLSPIAQTLDETGRER